MSRQEERALQSEVMLRLKAHPVIIVPIPNGIWVPARTPSERILVARIINTMKSQGMMLPGAADLAVFGRDSAGLIELKRSASKTLLGKAPKGQLSDNQKTFRDRCLDTGVNWAQCDSWASVESALKQWGILA